MRIIAGELRGRRLLAAPPGLRPTSDRLRESLFDVLSAARPLAGARWLELYAGSGAVAFEALSRGAAHATLVESSRPALAVIRANLRALGLAARARVLAARALRGLESLAQERQQFDICFLDPPYAAEDEYAPVLGRISASGVLRPGGLVIAEHSKRFSPAEEVGGLTRYRLLPQGDAVLSFYRCR